MDSGSVGGIGRRRLVAWGGLAAAGVVAAAAQGGIHVATPAIGANNGEGSIIRLTGVDGTPPAIGMPAPCPAPGATPVPATPAA